MNINRVQVWVKAELVESYDIEGLRQKRHWIKVDNMDPLGRSNFFQVRDSQVIVRS